MTNRNAQVEAQRIAFDASFEHGSRKLVTSDDALVRYLTRWRMVTAWRRLRQLAPDVGRASSVLFLCAGDAGEATVLADEGVADITITDLSERAVAAATAEDPRLTGFACNALETGIPDGSYDVVVVQDGLHHLLEPVTGFAEMLRISRRAAFFLEPHDSLAGRIFGMEWEPTGATENYVFRWDRHLVDQVAKSLLGREAFTNHSFAFWHHNVRLDTIGRRLGGGARAVKRIDRAKRIADSLWSSGGNQFCGMVIRRGPAPDSRGQEITR